MTQISTLAIDLAKQSFQLLGINKQGKPCLSKRLSREALKAFLIQLPPCSIVMEACATAHYWGRLCLDLDHQVKLIPAQHVTPFVRGNKNDKNDCMAIYEASQRVNLRFVPVKSEAQQGVLVFHRMRERLIVSRTALINQTRSLLLEFGVVIPQGHKAFKEGLHQFLAQSHPLAVQVLLTEATEELGLLNDKIQRLEAHFIRANKESHAAHIMLSIPGVGPLIASAFSASIDKGQAFSNAKELGVWLGLTPKQYASGNTNRLSGITKRGDGYLRKQLIHGARSIVHRAHKKDDDFSRWITQLVARIGKNKAVVATAHKMARLMWILLQKGELYQAQFKHRQLEQQGEVPCSS